MQKERDPCSLQAKSGSGERQCLPLLRLRLLLQLLLVVVLLRPRRRLLGVAWLVVVVVLVVAALVEAKCGAGTARIP